MELILYCHIIQPFSHPFLRYTKLTTFSTFVWFICRFSFSGVAHKSVTTLHANAIAKTEMLATLGEEQTFVHQQRHREPMASLNSSN